MQESNSRFFGISPGHKLIALLLAGGVAWGGHVLLRHRAVLKASAAQLSFDPRAARTLDSGLATIPDPAIALAQSFFTDQEVEKLDASAPLASSTVTGRIGEFRSRLQLSQPDSTTLEVRYLGAGNTPSIPMANSIAQAIASWTPTLDARPLEPGPAQGSAATTPPPAPLQTAPAKQPNPNTSALVAAIGNVQTLLSNTKRDLDTIAAAGAGGQHPSDPAAYRESDQQHLIRDRVAAAEQQLSQTRSSAEAKDAPPAVEGHIGAMQHAVASIVTQGVGISAARLRGERAQLDGAIATVDRERLAIQKETATDASPGTSPAAAPPSTTAAPPQNSHPTPTETNLGPSTHDILPNPLTFTHRAAAPAPTPWWPGIAAGALLGLFYWSLAALTHREPDYIELDTPESGSSNYNLITPSIAPPLRPEPRPEPVLAPPPEPERYSPSREDEIPARSGRRASFRFEPDSHLDPPAPGRENAVPETAAPEMAQAPPAVLESAPPQPVQPQPAPPDSAAPSRPTVPEQAALSETEASAVPSPELMRIVEPPPPLPATRPASEDVAADAPLAADEPMYAPDPLFDFFAPPRPRAAERRPVPNDPPDPAKQYAPGSIPSPESPAPQARAEHGSSEPVPFTPPYPFPIAAPVTNGEPQAPTSLPEALLLTSAPVTQSEGTTLDLSDTWVDDVRKALAETDIGRRFEGVQSSQTASSHEPNDHPVPARTNRLAG